MQLSPRSTGLFCVVVTCSGIADPWRSSTVFGLAPLPSSFISSVRFANAKGPYTLKLPATSHQLCVFAICLTLTFVHTNNCFSQTVYQIPNKEAHDVLTKRMYRSEWTVEGLGKFDGMMAFANDKYVFLVDRKDYFQHRVSIAKLSDVSKEIVGSMRDRIKILSSKIDVNSKQLNTKFESVAVAKGVFEVGNPMGTMTKMLVDGEIRLAQIVSKSGKVYMTQEYPTGLAAQFFPDGTVFTLSYSINGEIEMMLNLFDDGTVSSAIPLGKSPMVTFFRDGSLATIQEMKDGLQNGRMVFCDSMGKGEAVSVTNMQNGKELSVLFDKMDAKTKEKHDKDNELTKQYLSNFAKAWENDR